MDFDVSKEALKQESIFNIYNNVCYYLRENEYTFN